MEKFELTFPQKNIWLVENFYESKLINIISGSLIIKKDFEISKAEQTVNKFVEINEGMRLRLCVENSVPKQYVTPFAPFEADKINVEGKTEQEIDKIKEEYISTGFDVIEKPLFSYLLIDRGQGVGEIFLKAHHLICDGWSGSKMVMGLAKIYDAILEGNTEFEASPSYLDYIAKEKDYTASEKFAVDEAFWNEYLKGFNETVSIKNTYLDDSKAKRYSVKLNERLNKLILDYCKENKFSPFTIFMTALAIYLERTTEKQDIVIGTPILNRGNFAEKQMQGMFVSTMPVRFKINEQMTFKELCSSNAKETMSLFRHQRFPISKTIDNLKKNNGLEQAPYQVMVSYQNARATFDKQDTYRMSWNFSGHIQDELEIHIVDLNDDGILEIDYDYVASLFEDKEIEYIAKRIETIIEDGIVNDKTIETVEIMPKEERKLILDKFNDTKVDYPRNKTVIDLFEEQVKLNPNRAALVFEGEELTYKQLNVQANKLAHYLKENGIREHDFVAITIDKSFELMIAILATLKLGACYVPIDTGYSLDRKEYIINDANCKLNITTSDREDYIKNVNITKIDLENYSSENISRSNSYNWDSLVYVMYTSGTTGRPKGAMITNRNIVRLVKNTNYITFEEEDRIIQTGATVFDASTFEYWGALLNGLRLYLIKKETMLNPIELDKYLSENKISVMFITTALFNQMVEYNSNIFTGLRVLLTGGEVMSLRHINMAIKNNKHTQIANIYGPTENTTFSTFCNLNELQTSRVPIGKPINNTTAYILDSKNRLLPMYTEGELCLGGDGVGKGYLNNDDLTNKVFINNPYGEGKLYKCGDICSFREDGNIEFAGRRDNQVKVNGFRIELDEIQNEILKLNSIKEAAAVLIEKNSIKQINLYYVSAEEQDNDNLLNYLKEKLPVYMIPSGIMALDKMPLNQNGKVDKKRLPEIVVKHIEEDMSDTEKKVANLIKEEFGIQAMLHSNLFDIGLDSLSVIRLVACLQDKFKTDITTRHIMKLPTVCEIAKYLNVNTKEKVSRNSAKKEVSITAAQKSIFMAYMKDTETTLYNIPFEFELIKDNIDVNKLVSSIEMVINNHKTFFTKFNVEAGEITQDIIKKEYKIDVKHLSKDEFVELRNKFVRPFDLLNDLLFRINVVEVENTVKILCDFHHSIFDGYSLQLFLNELEAAYKGNSLCIEKATYLDYVNDSDVLQEDIDYFKSMFEQEIQVTDMPYDRPRKKHMDYEGNKIKIDVSKDTYNKLLQYIQNNNFTVNSLMQSIYDITLAKYTYSDDVTIGISDANRVSSKYNNTVGMFVKTLPYREIIDWKKPIAQFIKETQTKILGVYGHNTCAYEDLLKHVEVNRMPNRTPLFDTLFVCQNKVQDITLGDNVVSVKEIQRPNAKFDITFEVVPSDTNMYITVEYKTTLYDEITMRRFVNNYLNVLNYVLNNPRDTLYDIEMISKEEKEIIVNQFNNTKTDYPNHSAIHQIFEDIVETHKEKTAIVFENETLTYDELNKRANRLARYLLTKDVKRGDVIGIMIDKSSEYMVAVLGTLKAGLVYMPIAVDTPIERLKYLITNANSKLLLTTKAYDREIEYIQKVYINYNEKDNDYKNIKNNDNLDLDITADDKAYIMYTSGTTGTPKGIVIPHRGIVRLLINNTLVNFNDEEVMLATVSTTFDASCFEIWGAMLYGMTLHFIKKKDVMNSKVYERYIRENKITTTVIPTPIFNQLVEYNPSLFETMHSVHVGGEALIPKFTNLFVKHCPNTKLVDVYGPTENSVICSSFIIDKEFENDIPIGKPISNATCYVVDKCEKICPIGVPGDLYTGGDGLGYGYINRPELTNEKFTTLKTINEKIYKTGDLCVFYADGNIKFIGRIDTQIKLRGQRIEILEIQNKMLEIDGIKECVVMLKGEENNKFLVAYYTSEENNSKEDITAYLKMHLPIYMIPTKYVKLDSMPLNQNGKIDIHNLPEVKNVKLRKVDAKNDNQRLILDAYRKVLENENIGMTDDFFEIGGDSLLAMNLVGNMDSNGVKITYSDVFKYTTPKAMYKYVFEDVKNKNKLNNIDIADYDYSKINKLLLGSKDKSKKKINNVLLTGATGFLGIHILKELITNKGIKKVYCIVRDKNGKDAAIRLKDKLNYYFGNDYDNLFSKKVVVIKGDIIQFDLIDKDSIKELKEKVDCIINSVAYVKHFGKAALFEKVNVEVVNNLINFCLQNGKKLLHISTTSVSGNVIEGGRTKKAKVDVETIFDETKLYVGQDIENVYVLSKYIAERNILESIIDNNLDATILRVGNLMGRYSDGMFQKNISENAFINRIKTIANLGVIPNNIKDIPLEFTPVDDTAKAIVKLIDNDCNFIYHIYNKNHIDVLTIKNVLESIGYKLRYVIKEEMTKIIKELITDDVKQKMLAGIIQDLDGEKVLDYSSNIKGSCDMTVQELRKLGFEWEIIDVKYIERFFNRLQEKNFFKGE